jgi:NDP-sugar pyrophosphorylase family protein
LTNGAPKSLARVNGRPFVAHQLDMLRAAGFHRAVICAGFLGDQIVDCVKDGRSFGMNVQYSFDGPVLLGTGGAIRKALPLLGTEFFVIYGDSFLDCDYAAVYRAFLDQKKRALMTVFRNDGQWDTSNVEFSGGQILAYSKTRRTSSMQYIDYGLGVFARAVFEEVPANEPVDLSRIYEQLLALNQLASFEVTRRFYEIGTPQGLKDLSNHLKARESRL